MLPCKPPPRECAKRNFQRAGGLIGRHCRGGENDYKGGDQLDDKGTWHDKGRVRALALAEIAPQDACHAAPCLPLVHHPLCKYVVQEPYESLKGRFEQLPCMDACAAVPCVRARQSREIAVCCALRCSGRLLALQPAEAFAFTHRNERQGGAELESTLHCVRRRGARRLD